MSDPIRARLDEITADMNRRDDAIARACPRGPGGQAVFADPTWFPLYALRAVLDLCDVVESNRANFDAFDRYGAITDAMSHTIRRVIAEHLGVTDARCVRCGGEGPFNSSGWCQDCASPVYT